VAVYLIRERDEANRTPEGTSADLCCADYMHWKVLSWTPNPGSKRGFLFAVLTCFASALPFCWQALRATVRVDSIEMNPSCSTVTRSPSFAVTMPAQPENRTDVRRSKFFMRMSERSRRSESGVDAMCVYEALPFMIQMHRPRA